MVIPEISYAPLYQASSYKYAGEQSKLTADSMGNVAKSINLRTSQAQIDSKRMDLNQRSLDMQGRQIDDRRSQFNINAALGVGELILNAVPQIIDIVKQGQLEKSKLGLMTLQKQYQIRQEESILNGKSKFIQQADGNYAFEADQELEDYKKQKLAEIENSGNFQEVKNWASGQAQGIFLDGQGRAVNFAVAQARATADAAFEQNLTTTRNLDLAKPEGYENSDKAIMNNKLLSPMQQEIAIKSNHANLDYLRADKQTVESARQLGMDAANAKIKEYEDSGQFSPKQIEDMTNRAKVADGQAVAEVKKNTGTMMSDTMNSGKNPKTVYDYINEKYDGERKKVALEEAKIQQASIAFSSGMKQWNTDEEKGGLDYLKSQRKQIASGGLSAQYEGVPGTKEDILNYYDQKISQMEAAEKAAKAKGEKEDISGFIRAVQSGDSSYRDAMGTMQNKGYSSDSINDFAKWWGSNNVRDEYKPFYEQFLKDNDAVYLAAYGKKDVKDLSMDTLGEMRKNQAWVTTALMDLMEEADKTNMNAEKLASKAQQLRNIFTVKHMDALKQVNVKTSEGFFGIGAVKAIDDATKINSIFSQVDTVYQDGNSEPIWANKEIKETFNNVGAQFKKTLEENDIKLKPQAGGEWWTLMKDDINDVIPQHVFEATNGNKYSWFGDKLMENKNDGKGWNLKTLRPLTEQEKLANAAAERKAAQDKNIATELPGTPINVNTGQIKQTTPATTSGKTAAELESSMAELRKLAADPNKQKPLFGPGSKSE